MSSLLKGKIPLAFVCLCTSVMPAAAVGQSVLATIPVAGFVGQGSVDSIARKAYLPTGTGTNAIGQVTVIDENTNKVSGIITLPTQWQVVAAALNPLTNLLYVGAESGGLYVVNPKTGAIVGFVNVSALSVAVNPVTNRIYVSDFNSTLYVIDGYTNNIITSLSMSGIENVAVNPVTNRIYAALQYFAPGAVGVVDGNTNQQIAQVPAGSGLTFGVAVDPVRNLFYSAEQFGTVTVYDGKTNTMIKSIAIPGQPSGLSVDPIRHDIYVSDYANNALDIIDGSTYKIEKTLAVGTQPEYSTLDPFLNRLYVGITPAGSNGYPSYDVTVVKTN